MKDVAKAGGLPESTDGQAFGDVAAGNNPDAADVQRELEERSRLAMASVARQAVILGIESIATMAMDRFAKRRRVRRRALRKSAGRG